MANPIIIKDWQQGVADSAYQGIAMMRNADIELYPGSVKPQLVTTSLFHVALSTTFTADPSTDIITVAGGTVPNTGTAVTVSSSGSLPAGLSAGTVYFVIKLSSSTFKLATTIANANANTNIDITGAGSGTHSVVTVNPTTIKHIVRDQRSDTTFFQDSSARVWYLPNGGVQCFLLVGNTLTGGNGNGLALFMNSDSSATYLFAFRNASIDVVNVYGSTQVESPSWSNSWQSLNTGAGAGNSHHAILAQDNIIYFCDSRYIGTILEKPGQIFDPANAATYTFNNQALDTPQNEILNWLEELGTRILAAGDTYNFIYPWDRVSNSYDLPLAVPEASVKKLKNSGGLVYILAGSKGNIYTTQGTYVNFFKKIPGYLTNNSVTWGGIALRSGALLVGLSGLTGNSGVYLIYPDGRIVMDHQPSTGSGNVTALYAETDLYYLGYSGGADVVSGLGTRYSNYETVVQSAYYAVADKTKKAVFSQVEAQMGKIGSGSIRVGYRTALDGAFTTLATFTSDGSSTSYNADVGIIDVENIQMQVEIAGDMELMELRLFP